MSSIKTILYVQKTLKNNQNPVMLYIYEDKPYRISLGYSCTPKEWDEKQGRFKKNVENYMVKNLNLRKFELKASEIIDNFVREGKRFHYDTFKNEFLGLEKQEKSFYEFFEDMIEEKRSLDKIGTMLAYKDALTTMRRFKRENLSFIDVNYSLLKGLEVFLFQTGSTGGGIGARMRSIRAVYYEGIMRGLTSKENNPFTTSMNKNGYSLAKLKSKKNPRALSEEDLQKLKKFEYLQHPTLINSYLYFMFSYYMFGMNFADISTLKKENVHDDRIIYERHKTGKQFNIRISSEAKAIIEYFKSESNYLFPILNDSIHKTAQQRNDRTRKILKKCSKDYVRISNILGLENQKFTFYTARHSSATSLKRGGVSTDIISEALGHSNTQVTQLYLKQFENSVLDNAMSVL